MADPFWRYSSAPERDGVPRASFPGYLPSDNLTLASHHLYGASARGASSDYLKNDVVPLRASAYNLDDLVNIGSQVSPGIGGLPTVTGIKGYPAPLEDPTLIGQRRDAGLGIAPGIPDILPERSDLLRKTNGLSTEESNILFVDGLPSDCTRREVAHLFRPFIGFKEIRVIHKEPRRSGDKASVLCFVEFNDAKCAFTALEALQGYKFDDKKPDAPVLRIQFAQFPFRPSSGNDDRLGSIH